LIFNYTGMSFMFRQCYKLETIYVSELWTTPDPDASMFEGCPTLVGGKGTVFDSDHSDGTYAHIDGGESDPGYFTYKPFWDSLPFDEATETLTLTGNIVKEQLDEYRSNRKVKHIVADSTAVLPEDCSNLFENFYYTWDIDLSAAKCDYVNNITKMFYNCQVLSSLNMSSFDLSWIDYARYAFAKCSSLKEIYVQPETEVSMRYIKTGMDEGMFSGCTSLAGSESTTFDANYITKERAHVDGGVSDPGYFRPYAKGMEYYKGNLTITQPFTSSTFSSTYFTNARNITVKGQCFPESMANIFSKFPDVMYIELAEADFSNVTSMKNAFNGLKNLKYVNFGDAPRTERVTDMQYMFRNCPNMTFAGVYGLDTRNVKNMSYMFQNCGKLYSGGLEVTSFDTRNVTTMSNMFEGCTSLDAIDLSSFDTGNVTSMAQMFKGCSAIGYLDISSFNTGKVTTMKNMFSGCSTLKQIYAGSSWNVDKVPDTEVLFSGNEVLHGQLLTQYSADHQNKEYARIDRSGVKGYLSSAAPEFVTNSMTLAGSIGLNFYVVPGVIPVDTLKSSYVTFTVNGKNTVVPFNENKMNAKKTAYGFTLPLNSVSMADDVTATLGYTDVAGVQHTVSTVSNGENYLKKVNASHGEKLWNLIKAINDYGYYMQQYLSKYAQQPWTLGKDHKAMEKAYISKAGMNNDLASYKTQLAPYAKTVKLSSDIEKINYSLGLESDTILNIKIKPKSTYKGTVKIELDGVEVTPVKLSDGRLQVSVTGISAHKLADAHTVRVTTGKNVSTYKASALSYANDILNRNVDPDDATYAMIALYRYYTATMAYKNS